MSAVDFKDGLIAEIPNLRAFAASLSGSMQLADDLVQDTLLKAWGNADKFQPGTSLRAWLFTILRNTYYSLYRKRGREVQDSEGTYADRLASPNRPGRLALFIPAWDEGPVVADMIRSTLKRWGNRDYRIFVDTLKSQLTSAPVEELPLHINDGAFARACVDAFVAIAPPLESAQPSQSSCDLPCPSTATRPTS